MSPRGSRRGSSRRCYYANVYNRRRSSSTYYRESNERSNMSFRERNDRSASPSIRLRYVDTRRRDSRSASPKKDLRSVSPMSTRPICAETSSSTESQSAHAVKPKDFRVPLTCFFWYHTGVCKKPDNKCLYAHYHTGTVAEPPISYNGKAMGGNRAKKMIGNIGQREEELDIRGAEVYDAEQRIAAAQADLRERTNSVVAREEYMQQREQALQQRTQDVQQREQTNQQRELGQQHKHYQQREHALLEREKAIAIREHANHEREQAFAVFEEGMLRQLEGNYEGVASTVSQMRRAVGNAQGILANRRQQVLYHENFPHVAQGAQGLGKFAGSIVIDGAIGALGGLDHMLGEGEIALLAQIHNAIHPQPPH